MALFNQLYQIKGKHADMVRKLKEKLGCRNLDIFFISIVLGMWQQKKVNIDETPEIEPAKIDPEQMVRFNSDIEYFYELMLLSDEKYCPVAKKRVDRAFRYKGTSEGERDESHFTKVMLGGLEYLYENVIENTNSTEDIFNNIYELLEMFNDITADDIEE